MRKGALWACAATLIVTIAFGQSDGSLLDDPAIEYMQRPLRDPVAELSRRVEAGKFQFRFDGGQGYLRSVLEALHVPVESQMAVFSKTSVQLLRVDPQHPRMLYFNDSVAVGWVRGGPIELAALDPQQGMIFYTVDQREWVYRKRTATPAGSAPLFERRTDCLSCHVSEATRGVPGTLVRSVFPWIDGTPLGQFGVTDTDQRTPFEKLWGGWYVTGNSGSARHMGNAVVSDPNKPESMLTGQAYNLESLKGKFDTGVYPSPYSDIVALMVFEHQTHMMNLLIEMGWKIRAGVYRQGALREAAKELVDYLLFADEPPLTDSIQGTSGFAEKFATEGPFDSQGRSLRQLDLNGRLMRYPCSYMIYSDAFDGLPAIAKEAVYQRTWQILSGALSRQEKGGKYARLSRKDRQAIVEILRETKKGLPDYFGSVENERIPRGRYSTNPIAK